MLEEVCKSGKWNWAGGGRAWALLAVKEGGEGGKRSWMGGCGMLKLKI